MSDQKTAQKPGGSLPGEIGDELVRAVELDLGSRTDVVICRNPVIRARAPSGAAVLTGIGGKGAPDLHCEVKTDSGLWVCVWLECKAGTGRLSPDQTAWREAALKRGRHVFTVRSVEDAREAVRSVQTGLSQGGSHA